MDDFQISALDGHQLAATHFEGKTPGGPVVLFSSGTAIPRQFYKYFASWLAQQGAGAVITYDYRGIGDSWPDGKNGARGAFKYLMSDWARQDFPAAIDYVKNAYPNVPFYTVGHSFGGQVFGLTQRNELVEKSVMIASMSGHWRQMAFPENYKVFYMLYIMGPLVAKYYGYMPGKFGLGEDMASEAFLEWAGWCKSNGYFFDDPAMVETMYFKNYKGPMLALGMDDDSWGTSELIDNLVNNFTNADLERQQCSVKEAGGKVGHFGFFRRRFEHTLWPIVSEWLFER